MSTYIVGDIQGCLEPLKRLLGQVQFDPDVDELWSVGDIVNRGPNSLDTLRFLKNLGKHFKMVLGNHDLHLLAVACAHMPLKKNDTINDVLIAPDRDELIDWLSHQPLIYQNSNDIVVHAGIPHIWSITKALTLAKEVECALQSDNRIEFLSNMYGNQPDIWSDELQGMERLRVITNYLTRMRVCTLNGTLNLAFKSSPDAAPKDFYPWFTFYSAEQPDQPDIFFGHWALLESKSYNRHFHALDSGCVWGKHLTLINKSDKTRFISSSC